MPELMPASGRTSRRRLLAAAVVTPVLLGVTGCQSARFFAGPDPLAGPSPLGQDTVVLEDAMSEENSLMRSYRSALRAASGGGPGTTLLGTLLGQHQQQLAQLSRWLVIPAGAASTLPPASPESRVTSSPATASPPVTASGLQTAETMAARHYQDRALRVRPALAQLFASIAASDLTHASALGRA